MLRVDWNLLLTIINLLLLFVLMRIFLFKPVQKIIAARQEEADRQFKEAGESKQAAEEARKQYEASLANAEEAKKQVLQEARQTADAEYKRIVSDAEKTAKQVRHRYLKKQKKILPIWLLMQRSRLLERKKVQTWITRCTTNF